MKILLIGESTVGKTTILNRYVDGVFTPTPMTTVGIDFKTKQVMKNGVAIKIHVWDTAGQERFRTLTTAFFRGAHGVFFVYDVSDVSSFLKIQSWLETVNKQNIQAPMILLGNKIDSEFKQVTTKQAEEFAKANNMKFIEISAKHGTNINHAMDIMIDDIYRDMKDDYSLDKTDNDDYINLDKVENKQDGCAC